MSCPAVRLSSHSAAATDAPTIGTPWARQLSSSRRYLVLSPSTTRSAQRIHSCQVSAKALGAFKQPRPMSLVRSTRRMNQRIVWPCSCARRAKSSMKPPGSISNRRTRTWPRLRCCRPPSQFRTRGRSGVRCTRRRHAPCGRGHRGVHRARGRLRGRCRRP